MSSACIFPIGSAVDLLGINCANAVDHPSQEEFSEEWFVTRRYSEALTVASDELAICKEWTETLIQVSKS